MPNDKPFKPDDFPVEVEDEELKPIAKAKTPAIAEDIADRLNEDDCRKEEDRWSASSKVKRIRRAIVISVYGTQRVCWFDHEWSRGTKAILHATVALESRCRTRPRKGSAHDEDFAYRLQ